MELKALVMISLMILGGLVSFGSASVLVNFPSFARGFFTQYKLQKEQFINRTAIFSEYDVSFNFTTEYDYPELPYWLHLEQRTAEAPAFLYGAPGDLSKSTKLEVIGWDKETYMTERIVQDLMVTDDDFPFFQAEFFIVNRTLDEFLASDEVWKISEIVKNYYWAAADLNVTMVISAIGHGGRVPLPETHDHEGVIVRVGSREMWPANNDSGLQPGEEPSIDYFKDIGIEIKWADFKWIDLRKVKSPEALRQELLPEDNIIPEMDYAPPEFDDSCRDFDVDFILIVVIPIIVILLFVLILSLIMCFGREGKRKRDQQTPHLKLTHHHNIQRSTLRLRELSKPREPNQPHASSEDPTRPGHAHGHDYERLPEDGEDDRTDGRNAPPPYRMPPGSAGKGEAQQV